MLAPSTSAPRPCGPTPDYLLGNVVQAGNGQNPARAAAVRGDVDRTVPGITLNDVCLASMSSVALAAPMVRAGEIGAALVGGFESMSRARRGNAPPVAPDVAPEEPSPSKSTPADAQSGCHDPRGPGSPAFAGPLARAAVDPGHRAS